MAVRRVRRIVRKIDPWTVLKASFVFNAVMGLVFVLGTWVMWSLVVQKGIPEEIVELFDAVTIELTIESELYFRIIVLLAIIGVVGMTAFMTLGAVIYNLISDLVGGVEITVLEETYNVSQPPPAPVRRRPFMRPPAKVQGGNGAPVDQPRERETVRTG